MKTRKFMIGAASLSLFLSPVLVRAAIAPGGSFTASASCGNYEGAVSVTPNNATITSAGSWCDRGGSVSATATAGGAGTASVSFTVVDATDVSDPANPKLVGNVNIGGTSVTVAAPTPPSNSSSSSSGSSSSSSSGTANQQKPAETPKPEKEPEEDKRSKDTDLKSLSVSEGTLSPKFSKGKTSYKVNLPATANSITVKASANDAKSSVSGAGKIKLSAGSNEINIVVTSEYGTKKTYTIEVYVDEKPLIYTSYEGAKLGVVRNVNGVKAPDNFKKTKVKMDGKDITAWKNDKMGKTVVYLSDEKNNKDFYLFEDGKVTSKFAYKKILGRSFYLIDVPENKQKMDGMKYEKLKIDKVELMGWTFEDKAFDSFQVFMAMNMKGETHYYQYEKKENTLQLYSMAAPVTQEEYAKQSQELKNVESSKNIWMVSSAIAGVLAVAGIGYSIILLKKKKD